MKLLRDYMTEKGLDSVTATVLQCRPLPRVRTVQGDSHTGTIPYICSLLVGTDVLPDLVDTDVLEGYTPSQGDLVRIAKGDEQDGDTHPEFTERIDESDLSGSVEEKSDGEGNTELEKEGNPS